MLLFESALTPNSVVLVPLKKSKNDTGKVLIVLVKKFMLEVLVNNKSMKINIKIK
jgi:hypothetical protein